MKFRRKSPKNGLIPNHDRFDLPVELLFGRVDSFHASRTAYRRFGLDVAFAAYACTYRSVVIALIVHELRTAVSASDSVNRSHNPIAFVFMMQRNDLVVSIYDTTKKKMYLKNRYIFFEGLSDSALERTGRPHEDVKDLKVVKVVKDSKTP